MGHASRVITLRIYGHVVPGMGRVAAETFAGLLRTGQGASAQYQQPFRS